MFEIWLVLIESKLNVDHPMPKNLGMSWKGQQRVWILVTQYKTDGLGVVPAQSQSGVTRDT